MMDWDIQAWRRRTQRKAKDLRGCSLPALFLTCYRREGEMPGLEEPQAAAIKGERV